MTLKFGQTELVSLIESDMATREIPMANTLPREILTTFFSQMCLHASGLDNGVGLKSAEDKKLNTNFFQKFIALSNTFVHS